MKTSIVLNDMGRSALSYYGFRSWILQDSGEPYQVVLNLFNHEEPRFRALSREGNPNCEVIINTYSRPMFFNEAAANNLGIHFAQGEYLVIANADIIYPSSYLRTVITDLSDKKISYATGRRFDLNAQASTTLRPASEYTLAHNFDTTLDVERPIGAFHPTVFSPWVVERKTALAVGGFDSSLLAHCDRDFEIRVIHFLRRTGGQRLVYGLLSEAGFHLNHPTAEWGDASPQALPRVQAKARLLAADVQSKEDILSTKLDSVEDLVTSACGTLPPPPTVKRRIRKVAILQKLNRAVKAFRG